MAENGEFDPGNFSHDVNTNTTTCLTCNVKFRGNNKWNLKRHFGMCNRKNSGEIVNPGSIASKKHLLNVGRTTRQIIEPCVRLVTVHGKPFADLNSVGFRELFKPVS